MIGFVFRLIPPRPSFSSDMSEGERATMMEHIAYWSALAEEGNVLAFGPVDDPSGAYASDSSSSAACPKRRSFGITTPRSSPCTDSARRSPRCAASWHRWKPTTPRPG